MSNLWIINDVVFIKSKLFTQILSNYIDNSAESIAKAIDEQRINKYYSLNGIYTLVKSGSETGVDAFVSGMGKGSGTCQDIYGEYFYGVQFCEFTHQEAVPSVFNGYFIYPPNDLLVEDKVYYDFFELLDVFLFLGVPIGYEFFKELFEKISIDACKIMKFKSDDIWEAKTIKIGNVSDLISNLEKTHFLQVELLNRSAKDIQTKKSETSVYEDNIIVPESAYKVINALIEILETKNKINRTSIQLEIEEKYPNTLGLRRRNLQKIFGKASNSMK